MVRSTATAPPARKSPRAPRRPPKKQNKPPARKAKEPPAPAPQRSALAALPQKQQQFVLELVKDREANATEAYKRAGYTCRNDETAWACSARLLAKPAVKEAVAELMAERAARNRLDEDYVLHGLMAEAQNREPFSSHAARVRALELLGKHLGMFSDRFKVEHGGRVDHRHAHLHVQAGPGGAPPPDVFDALSHEARAELLLAIRARKAALAAGDNSPGAPLPIGLKELPAPAAVPPLPTDAEVLTHGGEGATPGG